MEAVEKKIEPVFHVCDKCGYENGFHVSFVKQTEAYEVILICPQCGQRFKINWKINLD